MVQDMHSLILHKATELFAQFGLRKTSMDDVARAAMVSKGTLYNYFVSKESLITEIVRHEMEDFSEKINKKLSQCATSSEKLRVFFLARHELLAGYRNLYNITSLLTNELNAFLPLVKDAVVNFPLRMRALLEDILREGVESGEYRAMDCGKYAGAIMHLIRGLDTDSTLSIFQQGDKPDDPDSFGLIADMILNGIRKGDANGGK